MNREIRLLMIVSGDTKFLEPMLPTNAWLQKRHIAYGHRIGRLSILVKTTGEKWPIRNLSEKVTVYPTNSANSLSAVWDLYREGIRIARKEQLNLIVTGDIFGCAWVAYALKRRLGIPLALQMLGDFVDNPYWVKERLRFRLLNIVAKWLIKRTDAVRVHGERVREKLIRRFGFPPEKVRAIPIPIQRESFLKVSEKEAAGKTVLWIGRMVPQKDLSTFLRTATRVLARHPEARFRLIGEGFEAAAAKALAKILRIDSSIEWVGTVPYEQIPDYLAQCDLLVLSSRFEDAPRVLVEASLAGRPVVTTGVGGADEVVQDGKTGFIIPVGDDKALAEKISLLFSEPERAKALGRTGREFAKTLWHFDTILEELTHWWQQAINRSGGDSRQPVVLVAESGSGFGGTAKYLYTLLSNGRQQPGHLQILTYRSGPFLKRVEELGYRLFRAPVLRFPWFENFLKPTKKMNSLRYGFGALVMVIQLLLLVPGTALWLFWKRVRLVHLNNEIHSHLVLLLAARVAGCRVLCHLHGWRPWTRLEKMAARFVHLYIGITHRGTHFYRDICPKGRFVTVANGVAFEQENGSEKRQTIRREFGLGENDICLGMLGRMIPEKGQEIFLETFQRIAQKGLPVHAFLVGGAEGDGSFLDQLHRKIEGLGIKKKVHFAGFQKETAPYLEAMDIVVSPSLIPESFGLGIAEAMAAGKPVVAHATGAVPELVQDRITGLLVSPDQPGRLEAAILELIRDRLFAEEMGERGREYVLQHFDIRQNVRKIHRIYKVLLNESRFLQPSVLTTYPIPQSPLWKSRTVLAAPRQRKRLFLGRLGIRDLSLVFRLFRMRRHFDLILTGAEREDCLFALLQSVLPGKKIPHIMVECLWKHESNSPKRFFKRMLLHSVNRSVDRFVVWSSEEKESHPAYFGLPRKKFVFVPHHVTLGGYDITPKNGDYIFSGGDSSRDYRTLLEAVEPLSVQTVIVARQAASWNGKPLPSHVTAKATDPVEFRRLMAGSRMVVLPFPGGMLQSAGQQTYLNAMSLRKPVIVSHVPGVLDYIIPDVTGIVVPPEDPEALRKAILRVLKGGPEIEKMVEAAHRRVEAEFSLGHFVERLLALTEELR